MTSELPTRVDVNGDAVQVFWADGSSSSFELADLRRACTCAQCTELRDRGDPVWSGTGSAEKLRVDGAELMGAWGLSLRWNDGHATGVYTWDSLRRATVR